MSKLLYWIPRVLAIIAILFMMMFSLDVFGGDEPLGKQVLGFLMHNVPAFILVGVLIIAWKWEIIGGILFIIASIAGAIFFRSFSGNSVSLVVIIPFFLMGILFIIHHLHYQRSIVKKQ